MKYRDLSWEEKFHTQFILSQFLPFTCGDIKVVMTTSVSANTKIPSQHCMCFKVLKNNYKAFFLMKFHVLIICYNIRKTDKNYLFPLFKTVSTIFFVNGMEIDSRNKRLVQGSLSWYFVDAYIINRILHIPFWIRIILILSCSLNFNLLKSECSKRVRSPLQHSNIKFVSKLWGHGGMYNILYINIHFKILL